MKYIILYIIVLAGCFTACQQEDSLTPSNISDLFAPNPKLPMQNPCYDGNFSTRQDVTSCLMTRYAMNIKAKILSVIRTTKQN